MGRENVKNGTFNFSKCTRGLVHQIGNKHLTKALVKETGLPIMGNMDTTLQRGKFIKKIIIALCLLVQVCSVYGAEVKSSNFKNFYSNLKRVDTKKEIVSVVEYVLFIKKNYFTVKASSLTESDFKDISQLVPYTAFIDLQKKYSDTSFEYASKNRAELRKKRSFRRELTQSSSQFKTYVKNLEEYAQKKKKKPEELYKDPREIHAALFYDNSEYESRPRIKAARAKEAAEKALEKSFEVLREQGINPVAGEVSRTI
ncbi:MAG: hypothetical protein HRT88_09745 [Lentisphaeraceae bacterium]|nr:hypothetical protein [Lentisphaeraceae bacterium]